MDAKLAARDFARMIRVGSHALKGVVANQGGSRAAELEAPINELLFMLDRFEELANEIEGIKLDQEQPDKRSSTLKS